MSGTELSGMSASTMRASPMRSPLPSGIMGQFRHVAKEGFSKASGQVAANIH
jgi:hypothetical protein